METVAALFDRERQSDRPALVTAAGRERSYRELLTNAHKAGNVLRHHGVRRGAAVAVPADRRLAPLLAACGAALLAAVVRFEPRDGDSHPGGNAPAARLFQADREPDADPPPGTAWIAYDGEPSTAGGVHWEAELWSENPAAPPSPAEPSDPLLAAGGRTHSHGAVLAAARSTAEAAGITAEDRVVVRGSLADPRVVAAGIVAPLVVGGAVAFPAGDGDGDGGTDPDPDPDPAAGRNAEPRGTVSVGRAGPEPRTVDVDDVGL